MEIHLVKKFVKLATAFLTLRRRFIVHLLQDLNNFFALFTLVFINGHGIASLPITRLEKVTYQLLLYSDLDKKSDLREKFPA